MHELSIASAIVEHLLEFAESDPPKKILGVRLLVGELSCIEPEQLSFCYTAITKETAIEDSTLEIERAEAEVLCPNCSYRGRPKFWEDVLVRRCRGHLAVSRLWQGRRGCSGARMHHPDHSLCRVAPPRRSTNSIGRASASRSLSRELRKCLIPLHGRCSRNVSSLCCAFMGRVSREFSSWSKKPVLREGRSIDS